MQYFKKIATCALAATMLFGIGTMFTGCTNSAGKTEVIQKDDLWFNTKKTLLSSDYDMSEYMLVTHNTPLVFGDKFAVLYLGQKNMTKEMMDDKDFDYNTLMLNDVIIYNKDGSIDKKIDINSQVSEEKTVSNITAITPTDDNKICVYFVRSDIMGINTKNYIAILDIESGKVVETKEAGLPDDVIVNNVSNVDGYDVITGYNYDSSRQSATFTLHFAKDGKVIASSDFDKDIGKDAVSYIESVYSGGEGKVYAKAYGEDGIMTLAVDPETGSASKVETEGGSDNKSHAVFDGTEYVMDDKGIRTVKGSEEVDFIPFDSCNVNIGEVSGGRIVAATENSAIIICESTGGNALEDRPVIVYELTKADENPNAGKKVIKVAAGSGMIDLSEGEGLRVFNENSKDYFAKVITYDVDDTSSDSGNMDEESANADKVAASLADQLAVDLMSGEGPDVILGASRLGELLNEEYLEDLTTYIGGDNGLDLANYYTNIIDAAKVDGKLYYMPNGFDIYGIVCDASKFDSQKGFTFDQYKEFVSTDCNGNDPFTAKESRLEFFKECMAASNDLWVKDGKANFDSEEFRTLATFFKDNVPEGVVDSSDVEYFGMDLSEVNGGVATSLSSISTLMYSNAFGDNVTLMGVPSIDGKGPSAQIYSSASISAKSEVKDGAWDLIKTMSSEEVLSACNSYVIPINKAAELKEIENVKSYSKTIVDLYKEMEETATDDDFYQMGILPENSKLDVAFEKMIESVDNVMTSDKSISMIVTEEIQAYFSGQKDLDTVIDTIQNRAQTVIEERK